MRPWGKVFFKLFTNLPPGDYTFKVMASDNPLQWNGKVTAIKLTIHAPWWKTTTAYILLPNSLFRSVTFLTTAIAKEMSYAGGLQRQALFSIALVLFVFIMIINVVLNVVLKGGDRDA